METQHSRRKMKLGKNTIDFLIFVAIIIVAVSSIYFYIDLKKRVDIMRKNPKVIEYNCARKKHFNLK